ncbi:MAG TPA: protein kinase [Candidatus Eisenbacteria bacterium]|nr:protein kinase [Candidatus Eisenbacteria bacterium]
MPLITGTKLGTYEILAPIGAGGMGEVYRARDTRLGREVAIKVLPRDLADTSEIRQRFEREARLISSLNHPNICIVHDVGHEGQDFYLVMELIEGESLATRIERGPLPTEDVLRFGIQIADALDRAHRAGIVHRDLKPGNVMLARSGAKLLDFGLARSGGGPVQQAISGINSPTMSRPLTTEGTIIGTFQYMAPEQLEGKESDERTDIWALGCVLYEMATGKRAFAGKSQASLISAIMGSEPTSIAQVAPFTPPALERLVKACLAKEPDERIQTAHDVKLQLQWIAEGGSQAGVPAPIAAKRRSRERLAWIAVGALFVSTLVLAAAALKPKPKPKPVIFDLTAPAQVRGIDLPRISPDGRKLAFNAIDSLGATCIWVRAMNSLDAQKIPGTEDATRPFWSPDSRFLAFFANAKLYKVDVNGGPPIAIADAPRGADGSWGAKNIILFDGTAAADSVQWVSAAGGIPAGATIINRKRGEAFTAWPQFLPDGKHFLYIAYGTTVGLQRDLRVGTIGSIETASLGEASSRVEYALGYLLYVKNGVLLARKFNAGGRKFTGDPFPVAQNVETGSEGSARFSSSTEGTLVYRTGVGGVNRRLLWLDRTGKEIGQVGPATGYRCPVISPDGSQIAVQVVPATGASSIWTFDVERNIGSRFTLSDTDDAGNAVWAPDGSAIAYSVKRGGFQNLAVKPFGGSGTEKVLLGGTATYTPMTWSYDGRWLFGHKRDSGSPTFDIFGTPMKDPPRDIPVLATPFHEFQPALSPDGTLLAYGSTESGNDGDVYVQTFPDAGGKWRVSTNSGSEPHWRADGRELFYLDNSRNVMSVSIEPGVGGKPPKFGLPKLLFNAPVSRDFTIRNRIDVTKDGKRFLVVAVGGGATVAPTTVVLDWLGRQAGR